MRLMLFISFLLVPFFYAQASIVDGKNRIDEAIQGLEKRMQSNNLDGCEIAGLHQPFSRTTTIFNFTPYAIDSCKKVIDRTINYSLEEHQFNRFYKDAEGFYQRCRCEISVSTEKAQEERTQLGYIYFKYSARHNSFVVTEFFKKIKNLEQGIEMLPVRKQQEN